MDDGMDSLKGFSNRYHFYLCQMGIIGIRNPHKLLLLLHERWIKTNARPSLQQLYGLYAVRYTLYLTNILFSLLHLNRYIKSNEPNSFESEF